MESDLWPHEQVYLDNRENPELSEDHRDDYARVLAITSMVGDEVDSHGNRFDFTVVETAEDISPAPKINLLNNDYVSFERYTEIESVDFEVKPKALSGKVDSAHAVLPGTLTVHYPDAEVNLPIVVKGSFKRDFDDRMDRLRKEITISRIQHENDEIAYQPIAAVIAPPVNPQGKSRTPQNEILLLTYYEESATSMDNAPWRMGLNEENIEAAERAVCALARFNTTVGLHGDSKIKNIVQKPDGSTSMIDFETSKLADLNDPIEVRHIVNTDLGLLFESLDIKGFFSDEPFRIHEVLQSLTDRYLEHWDPFSDEIQEAVYNEAIKVLEKYREADAHKLAIQGLSSK